MRRIRTGQGCVRPRIQVAVLLLALALSAGALAASAAKLGPGLEAQLASLEPADEIEVVVTFWGETLSVEQIAAVQALGITRGLTFRSLPILGLLATRDQVNALAAMPEVRSIWPNSELQYENFDATSQTGVQRLRATAALTSRNGGFPYSGRGIGVVVNDSGIDATHRDLEFGPHVVENVEAATNLNAFSSLLPITYIEGVINTDLGSGHGTHVAGIVGATGAQSGGKYEGVAPGAALIGYGSGAVIFVLDAVGGFDYAITHQIEHRIRVITNSFGNTTDVGTDFDPDDPINVSSKRAFDRGIVVVFSAGNSGPGEATITGNFKKAPWVIAVANGDKDGALNSSSSRGEKGRGGTVVIGGETFTWEDRPTVTAPGTFIISTRSTTNTVTAIAGQAGPDEDLARIEPAFLPFYTVLSGTSMSAPHAAGVVALILEADPSLNPLEVKEIIQQTATNVPGREPWEAGAGWVNALAAVDHAFAQRNYGTALNLTRSFNSGVELTVSETPFSIEYNTLPEASPTQNQFPFAVPAGLAQLSVTVRVEGATDVEEGNTINLVVIAPDGTERSSGVPVLFSLTFNRTVIVDSPAAGTWTVELRGLRGDPANPTDGLALPETVEGTVKFSGSPTPFGLDDIAGHPAEGAIKAAVGERLVDGFADGTFRPDDTLTRGTLADFLVMGAATRQFLPFTTPQTFSDVTAAEAPLAEAVAARGAALRDDFHQFRGNMLATGPGQFSPLAAVRRFEVAYSLVQSLGLEAEALSLNGQSVTVDVNGERIPIDDQSQIPAGFEGYVQLALDLRVLNAFFSLEQGPFDLVPTLHANFRPLDTVSRGAYAVAATRFLAAAGGF
ncbi:MAG: S8 family serine peptidase [Candidatus Acidiferrales bacterium]